MECRHEMSHTQLATRYDYLTLEVNDEYIEDEDFEEGENHPSPWQLKYHDEDFDYVAWEAHLEWERKYAMGF